MRGFPIATLTLVALMTVPDPGSAFTFLDLATGDEAPSPDARSIGLGRTRTGEETGAFTGASNPALLTRLAGTRISLGGNVLKAKETRAIPAYDSFDGFLVESIYVLNDEYQWQGGLGAAAVLPGERTPFPVGVGLCWAPIRDYQYAYSEEVRDNNAFTQPRDRLIALNEIQGDGSLGAWTAAIGIAPVERIALGFALDFVGGERDLVQRIRWMQEPHTDEVTLRTRSVSGLRKVVGLTYSPTHRADLSATWRTETTLEGSFARDGDPTAFSYVGAVASPETPGATFETTMPEEWSLGAVMRPRAKVRTTLRLDATLTEWSNYENGLWEDLALDDVWAFGFGIEHVFYNGFPARFGFRYTPSPKDDEIATTAFTLGGGFGAGPLRADVAFEVATRDYRAEDVFDDALFGGDTHVTKDKVEETGASAYLTLTYATE
jgi:hypothetical protein